MIRKLIATYKKILSYFKSNWTLKDYPLVFERQVDEKDTVLNTILDPWVVMIISWYEMVGTGKTKEEAYLALKKRFDIYSQSYRLPRPGTFPKTKSPHPAAVEMLEDNISDFFEKILDMDYHNCVITDKTTLKDLKKDDKQTIDKICLEYKIDIREIRDGNIIRILSQIVKSTGGG